MPAPTLASEGCDPDPRMVRTEDLSASMFDFRTEVAICCWVLPACAVKILLAKLATSIRVIPRVAGSNYPASLNKCWIGILLEHDLRANAFAFVAWENRFPLFRIML